MKKRVNQFLVLILTANFLFSCTTETPQIAFGTGIYVINEGPFQSGTGAVSRYDEADKYVDVDLFQKVNGRVLGNIVQSMEIYNGNAYIVVNNAGKVEVVNAKTFESKGVINNLTYPRYFLGIDNTKAYVSEWGTGINGNIKVINLTDLTVTKTIQTGKGPDKMIRIDNKVYIVNGGGFENDNKLTVINTSTDEIITTITVGDSPNSLEVDKDGNLWVLCAGKKLYDANFNVLSESIAGSLVKINPSSNLVIQTIKFASKTDSGSDMVINKAGDKLFYNFNFGVNSHSISATAIATTPLVRRNFYGLGIDPSNDNIYAADAGNYSSAGKVIKYTVEGVKLDSFNVGIIPNGFYFDK